MHWLAINSNNGDNRRGFFETVTLGTLMEADSSAMKEIERRLGVVERVD